MYTGLRGALGCSALLAALGGCDGSDPEPLDSVQPTDNAESTDSAEPDAAATTDGAEPVDVTDGDGDDQGAQHGEDAATPEPDTVTPLDNVDGGAGANMPSVPTLPETSTPDASAPMNDLETVETPDEEPGTASDPCAQRSGSLDLGGECTSLGPHELSASTFPGTDSVTGISDGMSTLCLEVLGCEQPILCASGTAADAGPEYDNWGTLVSIPIPQREDGSPATADVAGIELMATGADQSAPIRAVLQVHAYSGDDPIWDGYVHGRGFNDINEDGHYVLWLEDFEIPDWSLLHDLAPPPTPVAPDLKSLTLWIVTRPSTAADYNFCVSSLNWLDAAGNPLELDLD